MFNPQHHKHGPKPRKWGRRENLVPNRLMYDVEYPCIFLDKARNITINLLTDYEILNVQFYFGMGYFNKRK